MAAQKQLERVAKHSDRHLFLKHTLKLCCTERRNQTSKKTLCGHQGLGLRHHFVLQNLFFEKLWLPQRMQTQSPGLTSIVRQ